MRNPLPVCGGPRRASAWAISLALYVAITVTSTARADTVVRRDGSTVDGRVSGLDDEYVVLSIEAETVRIPRSDVASIQFSHPDVAPPLKVELRNLRSDDAVDVFLGDDLVLAEARERGEWVDLTPKLKPGNNALRLRIHNHRGIWAYQLNLRVNGVVTTLSCGKPLDLNGPCRCCGKTGRERGLIDDLPLIWLHVDRDLGTAEILP